MSLFLKTRSERRHMCMFNRDRIHPFFSALTFKLTKDFFLFDFICCSANLVPAPTLRTKWCIYIHKVSWQRKNQGKERERGRERESESESSTISRKLCRCVFTHQLGICRRLFHRSVSSRWSCSGRDCGPGRKGHEAGCRRGR